MSALRSYVTCQRAGCNEWPARPRRFCARHAAESDARRGTVPYGSAIPGAWLVTGEGERRSDCMHEYQCTTAAAKQSGEAHCPPLCSAFEPHSIADHDTERDHLASSRPGSYVQPEGTGWGKSLRGSGGAGGRE